MHQVPTVPVEVTSGSRRLVLDVPAPLAEPRSYYRLARLLEKERWAVAAVPPRGAPPTGGAPTTRAAQAAELYFVRDVLGPLRARPGAVPEKRVAHLLGIGVKALHARSLDLFNCSWAEFVAHTPALPPAAPLPTAFVPLACIPGPAALAAAAAAPSVSEACTHSSLAAELSMAASLSGWHGEQEGDSGSPQHYLPAGAESLVDLQLALGCWEAARAPAAQQQQQQHAAAAVYYAPAPAPTPAYSPPAAAGYPTAAGYSYGCSPYSPAAAPAPAPAATSAAAAAAWWDALSEELERCEVPGLPQQPTPTADSCELDFLLASEAPFFP